MPIAARNQMKIFDYETWEDSLAKQAMQEFRELKDRASWLSDSACPPQTRRGSQNPVEQDCWKRCGVLASPFW